MQLTKTQRAAIVAYVAEHTQYDAETVRISKDGTVSAIKDANKTFNGPHTERIDIGSVADMLPLIK